jgi:monoamine oxidase
MQKLEQQTTGVTVSYFNTLSTNHYALTSVPLATTYPITTVTQQLFRILLLANASELY